MFLKHTFGTIVLLIFFCNKDLQTNLTLNLIRLLVHPVVVGKCKCDVYCSADNPQIAPNEKLIF